MNISDIGKAETEDLLIVVDELRKSFGNYNEDQVKMEALVAELVDRGEYPAKNHTGKYDAKKMVDMYGALWHMYSRPHECPECDADLRDHENGAPYKREISIYSRVGDCTIAFQCPDCNCTWRR